MTTKTEFIRIRLEPSLKERLKRHAKNVKRNVSDMARLILDENIPNYELSGDSG